MDNETGVALAIALDGTEESTRAEAPVASPSRRLERSMSCARPASRRAGHHRPPGRAGSRNFSTKPPAAYAAALMRMQDPRGPECVRFIKQHWVMETDKPKNFELVWLTLAEKSLKEPFPR